MLIKSPACYDTSHWESVPDFALVNPRPLLVITKATEGLTYTDDTFDRYFTDLKQDGIFRGAYHFFRKAYDPLKQAQFFCGTLKPYINNKDILVLDIEEAGNTAAALQTFCMEVLRQYPSNLFLIYSRKNILDPIPMNATQQAFFKLIPVWTAGYPLNPDLYSTPPASYVPDPNRWGEVWMWQYTDAAIVPGINGAVDCNWLSPKLITWLGAPTPPPASDVVSTPYDGIQRLSGTRYGWRFVFHEIDPARVRIGSVYNAPLNTASNVGKNNNATLVLNGGEWDRARDTINYTVCEGVLETFRTTPQPSLMVTAAGQVIIDHKVQTVNIQQALTGLRYIVGPLTDSSGWNTEGHNRTIYGVNASGDLLTLCTEGAYPNQGWTLQQCRDFMLEQGAVKAFDAGGGGDVTLWDQKAGLLLKPQNGTETYLPNHLLIFAKESTMTTRYTATAVNDGTRLRPDHNTGGTAVASYPAGTVFTGDVLYTADVPLFNSLGQQYQFVGDQWLQVITPRAGWVAITWKSGVICTLKDNGVTPPPPVVEYLESETIEPAPGTIITKLYNTGRIEKIIIP